MKNDNKMMKKGKNRKKALTVAGAVVAAGLTPGIIAASPIPNPNEGCTAAQVVAIGGNVFSFEELYAKQQPQAQPQPQVATRYGVRPGTYYGVLSSQVHDQRTMLDREEFQRRVMKHLMEYCVLLIDADKRGLIISPESDLTRELGMNEDELKDLKAEIEERYGVEVSYHRFYLKGQLNNLRLVTDYIVKLRTR